MATKPPSNVTKLTKLSSKARSPRQPRQQVCVLRPNRARQRHFTERDAAKILCHVVQKHGGTRARFEAAFREVCSKEPTRKSAAEAALEVAMANIQQNDELETDLFRLFQIVNGIMTLLFQAIPFLRLPGLIARLVARVRGLPPSVVEAQMQVIRIQQSANASAFRIVQQAAQNEARFRLAAGE